MLDKQNTELRHPSSYLVLQLVKVKFRYSIFFIREAEAVRHNRWNEGEKRSMNSRYHVRARKEPSLIESKGHRFNK